MGVGAAVGSIISGAIRGDLYGTIYNGGNYNCNEFVGCGVVFRVKPDGGEAVLHSFSGGSDGSYPQAGQASHWHPAVRSAVKSVKDSFHAFTIELENRTASWLTIQIAFWIAAVCAGAVEVPRLVNRKASLRISAVGAASKRIEYRFAFLGMRASKWDKRSQRKSADEVASAGDFQKPGHV